MSVYSDHDFAIGSQNNSWSHLYDLIVPGSRVLDVGCSTAAFGRVLIEKKGCDVTGIDLDEGDIKEAKKNIGNAFVMDINSDEAIGLGKFDAIIFADVLEHLVDPRATLRKIKAKMLTEGGGIFFSIPHMAHISVRLQLLGGSFEYKERGLLDRTHLHFYDQAEVESMFADAGYEIAEMRPTVSSYPDKVMVERLAKLGLEANPEFFQMLDRTHASVFQFIGLAKASNEKASTKKNTLEYIMPQDEILEYTQTILDENKRLWTESQALHTENLRMASNLENIKQRPIRFVLSHAKKMVISKTKRGRS